MMYRCHFHRRDGFILEEDLEFELNQPMHNFRLREYPPIATELLPENEPGPLTCKDIDFIYVGKVRIHGTWHIFYEQDL
jgi:hypothetical protein